jgi:hypothetical protein
MLLCVPFYLRSVELASPAQIDRLKVLACVAMLIDHVNSAVFGGAYLWAIVVGRAALPVFVVIFALNLSLRSDRLQRSASRLWIAALIAQAPFVLALDGLWWGANILVLFAVVAQALRWGMHGGVASKVAAGVLLAVGSLALSTTYGAAGIVFTLASVVLLHPYKFRPSRVAVAVWWLSLFALNPAHWIFAAAGAVGLVALVWMSGKGSDGRAGRFVPPRAFLAFYVGHLSGLASVVVFNG